MRFIKIISCVPKNGTAVVTQKKSVCSLRLFSLTILQRIRLIRRSLISRTPNFQFQNFCFMESEVRKQNKKQKDAKLDLPVGVLHVDKMMFSRLLYTNPVCLLTTNNGTKKNVMTISWLTPINNKVILIRS